MDRDAVDVGGSNKTLKHASAIYLADQAPDPDCSRTREKLDSNRSIVLEVRLSFFFFSPFWSPTQNLARDAYLKSPRSSSLRCVDPLCPFVVQSVANTKNLKN